MVRLFVFSLLIIVVALWVTFYLGFPADPGYLLIAFRNYTFETSLFTLVVTLGAIYLLFRLLVIMFRWVNPAKLVRAGIAINEKRKARERSKTIEGMLYLIRGNWQSSYKLLKKVYLIKTPRLLIILQRPMPLTSWMIRIRGSNVWTRQNENIRPLGLLLTCFALNCCSDRVILNSA